MEEAYVWALARDTMIKVNDEPHDEGNCRNCVDVLERLNKHHAHRS